MVGLLPPPEENKESEIEIEVEVKKPYHLLKRYRVFIQDRGSGSRYLPEGSTILLQEEVYNIMCMYDMHLIKIHTKNDATIKQGLEVVTPERFLLLSVIEDSELLTFIESQVDPCQPDQKLVFHRGNAFYEFSHKSEDITGKKEVVLMDVVRSCTSTL